jgi:hypothetical protein
MKLNMWCDPRHPDWESHCWESRDDGKTWRDAGIFDGTPGEPEVINTEKGRCPRCKSPLRVNSGDSETDFLTAVGRALDLPALGAKLQVELLSALHKRAMQKPLW